MYNEMNYMPIKCPHCGANIGKDFEPSENKILCSYCNGEIDLKALVELSLTPKTLPMEYIPEEYIKASREMVDGNLKLSLMLKEDEKYLSYDMSFFINPKTFGLDSFIKPKNLFTALIFRGNKIYANEIAWNIIDNCETYENEEGVFVMKNETFLFQLKNNLGLFGPDPLKNSNN